MQPKYPPPMAVRESKIICDHLKDLMESKVKVEVCETKAKPSCAHRLEQQLEHLPEYQQEVAMHTDRLLRLYLADPEGIRPFLINHVLMLIGCIKAQDSFYRKHYPSAVKRQGPCDSSFLRLHIENLSFFREHKELLCLYIFSDNAQLQLVAALSPEQALDRISSNVQIVLVELGALPPGEELSKKKRFELLLDAGFLKFMNIKYAPKTDQLEKAAEIVGCTVRYLQELVENMKIDGRNPFTGNAMDSKDRLLNNFNEN